MRSHPNRPTPMLPLLAGLILTTWFLAAPLAMSAVGAAPAKPVEAAKPVIVREILVPMDDLNVLLENQPRRVLLSREEYEELLKKASRRDEVAPPRAAVLSDSRFMVEVRDGRAVIAGVLTLDVLSDGIHAVPLEMAHVGLRDAMLDDRAAPIGRGDDGRLVLFVEGRGQHVLRLSMTAPVEATAATQVLTLRLPVAPSARFDLTVEGDVEVKGGMEVVRRTLDDKAGVTRFELLPRGGDVSLVMTLNSRLRRKDQIVLARSVLLAMVGEAGQRLHSTVSLSVLHRAADLFRFEVPNGFEITKVQSPELASWSVVAGDQGRRVLEVRLREATTENVVLSIVAESNDPKLDDWTLPCIAPLDVDGQVAVVGILVDPRLRPTMVTPEGLIPIDASVLQPALPASVEGTSHDEPPRTAVAAYYAAGKDFSVRARFDRPAARFEATTVLLLRLSDKMQILSGDLIVVPEHETLFEIDFLLPAAWKVVSVVGAGGEAISFERHDNPARVHVRLPQGVAPGKEGFVRIVATATPAGWLGDWREFDVVFPEVRLQGKGRQRGAMAVAVEDDLRVVPQIEKGLIPLDEAQKKEFRLEGVRTDLAYRHDDGPFEAAMKIERTAPRLTAKTHSFLRIAPGMIVGRYEVTYDVTEARTRTLRFRLPNSTPADLAVVGLGGVQIKQYSGESTDQGRLWTVELAEARRGPITLAVDFQQPLGENDPLDLELPILVAEGVAHQSGLVAVEGSAELDVEVKTDSRRVDVGELVDAEYQPGRRLLGVFSFVGQAPKVAIDAFRRPAYALSTTIVQQGRLTTTLSAEGVAQTDARFQLRSKAIYLEVVLPEGARLWSVVLDGRPIKPQSQDGRLLLNLAGQTDATSESEGRATELQIVYEMPVAPVGLVQDVTIGAPRLLLREEADDEVAEAPLVGMEWELVLPWRYQVVGSESTLMSNHVRPPEPVILRAFQLFGWSPRGGLGCAMMAKREASRACETAAVPGFESEEYNVDRLSQIDRQIADKVSELESLQQRYGRRSGLHTLDTSVPATAADRELLELELESLGTADRDTLVSENTVAMQELGRLRSDLAALYEERQKLPAVRAAEALPEGVELPESKTPLNDLLTTTAPMEDYHAEEVMTGSASGGGGGYAKKKRLAYDSSGFGLLGLRGVKFDLNQRQTGEQLPTVVFQSLGERPKLDVTLADRQSFRTLGWAVAMAVVLIGLALGRRSGRTKFRYLLAVGLIGSLLPIVPGFAFLATTCDMAVFAVLALAAYYAIALVGQRLVALVGPCCVGRRATVSAALVLSLLAAAHPGAAAPPADTGPMHVKLVDPLPEVTVPSDAILIPYDPDAIDGIEAANRCFVPYDKYVDLWNRAYPDESTKPIAPRDFALAGASYTARLADGKDLLLEGTVQIVVYKKTGAAVALRLGGGVLADARLDGEPARLSVTRPEPLPRRNMPQQAQSARPAVDSAILLLHVPTEGRHELALKIRLPLRRQGGWHAASGLLPAAAASSLALTVPVAETDVLLGQTADRRTFETKSADERIETVLGPGGELAVQWRPRLSRAEVQHSLTARSEAVFDIQEDSLRLAWDVVLEFRRDERDAFALGVPADYLVENVVGPNVRGWTATRSDNGQR
ncbi:MAG: hypothetical protein GX621_05330, partial [Pirellulaceae bacterium]|nr:hypothetical protein [Pirellulaceae bacterium]